MLLLFTSEFQISEFYLLKFLNRSRNFFWAPIQNVAVTRATRTDSDRRCPHLRVWAEPVDSSIARVRFALIDRSIDQSIDQSIDRWIDRSITSIKSTNQSIDRPIADTLEGRQSLRYCIKRRLPLAQDGGEGEGGRPGRRGLPRAA